MSARGKKKEKTKKKKKKTATTDILESAHLLFAFGVLVCIYTMT
jgi:hypothetical protein